MPLNSGGNTYILLRSSGFVESMRSLFNDEKFIYRRKFWIKQAASAEEIYNYAVHTQRSTADSKKSKHRDTISLSTSNNSR